MQAVVKACFSIAATLHWAVTGLADTINNSDRNNNNNDNDRPSGRDAVV